MARLEYRPDDMLIITTDNPHPDEHQQRALRSQAGSLTEIPGVKAVAWNGPKVVFLQLRPGLNAEGRDTVIVLSLHILYNLGLVVGAVKTPEGHRLVPPHFDN
jgi:hypothetical protein